MPYKINAYYRKINKYLYFRKLIRSRFLPRKELEKIQLIKFRKLLIHAYNNVDFYREKYRKANINPYSIASQEDILKVPQVTKDEIRKNFPDKIIARGVDIRKCAQDSTSGSMGAPLTYIINLKTQGVRAAIHEYIRYVAGCSLKDNLLYMHTLKRDRINEVFGKNARFTVSSHADIEFQIKTLNSIKPDFIEANPSFLLNLIMHLKESDYTLEKPLKGIITTGEVLSYLTRVKIENFFKTKIFDEYGTSETAAVTCECILHKGMHVIMPHAYIEILKDNKLAEEMQSGRILITDLDNYAMPFIRYDTKDIARRSYRLCECGIEAPLIENIEGRTQDFLVFLDNRPIPPFTVAGFISPFRKEPLVSSLKQFKIIQDINKNVVIKLVTGDVLGDDVKKELIDFIKNLIGNVEVSIKILRNIPNEKSGKARYVVSKVDSLQAFN